MARTLSSTFKQAAFAQETDEVVIVLLTLGDPDTEEPIRVCSNSKDVVSRGETYIAFPFSASLPAEQDDQLARVRLAIDNVDRQVVEAIRTRTTAPPVTLEIVLASDPDTVEAGPFEFTLRDVSYNALTVEGELSFEDVLNEPFPADSITPAWFPGLF